jgi:hypothetical protein
VGSPFGVCLSGEAKRRGVRRARHPEGRNGVEHLRSQLRGAPCPVASALSCWSDVVRRSLWRTTSSRGLSSAKGGLKPRS